MNRRKLYLAIFVFVLAPIAAVVIISALLLFGVPAHAVFALGRAVQSMIGGPNRIAVASTAFMVWAVIAALGLAREFLFRR